MDLAAVIAKIVGGVLFLFTARSVYRHFKAKMTKRAVDRSQGNQPKPDSGKPEQSKVEHALNAFLLYAWFIFMTAFSLGLVFNN